MEMEYVSRRDSRRKEWSECLKSNPINQNRPKYFTREEFEQCPEDKRNFDYFNSQRVPLSIIREEYKKGNDAVFASKTLPEDILIEQAEKTEEKDYFSQKFHSQHYISPKVVHIIMDKIIKREIENGVFCFIYFAKYLTDEDKRKLLPFCCYKKVYISRNHLKPCVSSIPADILKDTLKMLYTSQIETSIVGWLKNEDQILTFLDLFEGSWHNKYRLLRDAYIYYPGGYNRKHCKENLIYGKKRFRYTVL